MSCRECGFVNVGSPCLNCIDEIMAFKEKSNKNDCISLTINRISDGVTSDLLRNGSVKVSLCGNGRYTHLESEGDSAKLNERKPLSSNISNKMQPSPKRKLVSSETVKAAEEILAVLQDSPVKSKEMSPRRSDFNNRTVVHKIMVTNNICNDKTKKINATEKLNNNDIAGMLFDDNDSKSTSTKHKVVKSNFVVEKTAGPSVKKSLDKGVNVNGKSGSPPKRKSVIFDEEDIFISLSDSDSSADEIKKDKVGEWTVTKSPLIKGKSPKQNSNEKTGPSLSTATNGSRILISDSKVRRSLSSQLESPKANKSINSPLRLKLKRKAVAVTDDEPPCKERRTDSPNSSPVNGNLESRGLRCRLMIKLPKWRQHEYETPKSPVRTPTKSIRERSSPITPKTQVSNVTPSSGGKTWKESRETKNSDKKSSDKVKTTKEAGNSDTKPHILQSASEIFDILSTPEKKTDSKNKLPNGKSPIVKSNSLKKLQDVKSSKDVSLSGAKIINSGDISSPSISKNKDTSSAEISSPRRSKRVKDIDHDSLCDSVTSSPARCRSDKKSTTDVVKSCPVSSATKKQISSPSKSKTEFSKLSTKKEENEKTSSQNKSNGSIISKMLPSPKMSPKVVTKKSGSDNDSLKENCCESLEEARTQLLASTIPQSLPCRGKEFNNIYSFILRKIEEKAGGCMYISGVPGTGKTATVHAVVKKLQLEAKEDDVPQFDFVEINGLRLTEPRQAYTRIWQSLTRQRLTPEQAHRSLDRKYSSNAKKPTVLLVDELDYLCNRRQDVVYSILDWPTKEGSGLVILTIANTMDLPERTLKGKVTSRMGLTRLVFQPYTHHQLQEIVLNRLSGNSSFHPDAVQLVARKVAAVSGDARRALDICRRATEIVDASVIVTIQHVEQALSQIFTGPRIRAIRNCSTIAQFVLRALRDETLRTGVDESDVNRVYKHLISLCTLEGIEKPTTGEVLSIVTSLEHLGILIAEKGRPDIMRKLSLNVSSDDIHYALSC